MSVGIRVGEGVKDGTLVGSSGLGVLVGDEGTLVVVGKLVEVGSAGIGVIVGEAGWSTMVRVSVLVLDILFLDIFSGCNVGSPCKNTPSPINHNKKAKITDVKTGMVKNDNHLDGN